MKIPFTSYWIFVVAIFLLPLFSCQGDMENVKEKSGVAEPVRFDREKWLIKEGMDYPFRDSMLTDLTTNYDWEGMKSDDVIELLGKPWRSDSVALVFMVRQRRIGLWPLNTKALVVKLNPDSSVNKVVIYK